MTAPETLAEARSSRKVNAAAVEVFYLGRVGAFAYLHTIAEALCARRSDGHGPAVPLVPDDTGLIPRVAARPGRRDDLGAHRVYAAAERDALAGIAKADDAEPSHLLARLSDGIAEGLRVRASLLDRGHPVPGRGCWLGGAR